MVLICCLFNLGSPRAATLYTCAQIYRAVLAAKPAASLGHLCTLSLVMHRAGPAVVNVLLRARARAVWDQAKTRCASLLRKPGKHVAVHERLVLESLDADEAAGRLSDVTLVQIGLDMGHTRPSPLHILGGALVRDRMKKHLGSAFIKTVGVGDQEAGDDDGEEGRQKTFSAAAELGGRLADLGKMAERLCRLVADDSNRVIAVSSELVESLVASSDEEDEVAALILALVLYQRVFPFHSRDEKEERRAMLGGGDPVFLLKKTLGNRVFEQGCAEGLEDARDVAVDQIVEIERNSRLQ